MVLKKNLPPVQLFQSRFYTYCGGWGDVALKLGSARGRGCYFEDSHEREDVLVERPANLQHCDPEEYFDPAVSRCFLEIA